MSFLFTLLTTSPYIDFPQNLLGRLVLGVGWLAFLGVNLILTYQAKGFQREAGSGRRRFWTVFIILACMVPLTVLFFGLRLPARSALPPPGVPLDPRGPALMLFAAIPWALAGGLLGPVPAAALAFLSGVFMMLWETHSPFTPLETALLAILFSAAVNQRYRTLVYRLLRHPFAAALLLAAIYPLIFLTGAALLANGSFANRLDYALTHVWPATLATGPVILFAGLAAEMVAAAIPTHWGGSGPLVPSPAERSLEARFLYGVTPMALILVLALVIGDWFVAGSWARQLLRDRLATTAQVTSRGVPYFLETGQNLILQLASNPRLYQGDPSDPQRALALRQLLEQDLRRVPYFRQLFLLDETGRTVAGYPADDYSGSQAPPDEQMGIQLALNGVPFQLYAVPPADGEQAVQISFMAAVLNEDQEVEGVLVGRTDLASNPFTQSFLSGLKSLTAEGGEGILLDEDNRILYHPNPDLLLQPYSGLKPGAPAFFDEVAPDGTRRLAFYHPVEGRPWAVVVSVPAQQVQQLALNTAAPLVGMIIILALLGTLLVRLGLRVVTGSLQNLSVEAKRIADGQLDHPLTMDGEDEVAAVGQAFEQMRLSLKARLDELNRLLLVSQGVASSLEIGGAVQPILEAALRTGACAARVVLSPAVVPEIEGGGLAPTGFGAGPANALYSDLDEQILALTRQQERITLNTLSRARLIKFPPGSPRPGALIALALRHENLYYGALWVAYDQPHTFPDDEIRFLVTLASQAALAAANARLFLTAEIGRQRLAAILASTPDPVLVTDQQNRLLLANPAAWRVLGLGMEWDEGQPLERVISQPELVSLFHSPADEKQSIEISLADGKVYYGTVSPVFAEGQRVGKVCVLRDITYFKELDALKSEFVATVSHDLRSPLTLMRGYSTMLEMVGELNEQQTNYVRKIVASVESMSRLVNNLLDLGRIEAGIDLQLEMVAVREVIERVVGALQLQASQKRVQINVEIAEQSLPLLEADQALLQQALHNLVENAVKYTEAGGRVTIRVDLHQGRMVFAVSDTGIGIAPVDQPRLFEKFYRGSQPGMKQQRGTGLGLAIVESIVERHGGEVWVESQLGKGSTFAMALPLRQPPRTRVEGMEKGGQTR